MGDTFRGQISELFRQLVLSRLIRFGYSGHPFQKASHGSRRFSQGFGLSVALTVSIIDSWANCGVALGTVGQIIQPDNDFVFHDIPLCFRKTIIL